jgi:hypothetical protein
MNFEKYTDRARGFVQSAQSLAARRPPAVRRSICSRSARRSRRVGGRLIDRSVVARAALAADGGGVAQRPSRGRRRPALHGPALARVFETEKNRDKGRRSF